MFFWLRRLFGCPKPDTAPPEASPASVDADTAAERAEPQPSTTGSGQLLAPDGVAFLSALLPTNMSPIDLHQLPPADRKFISDNLRRVHREQLEIPMLPGTIIRIQQLIANPEARTSEIVAIFKDDPTLSAELLRLANSSYIAYIHPTLDLQQAIIRVGFTQLHGLAIVFSIRSRIMQGNRYRNEVIWITELSLTMAKICQLLAPELKIPPEEAFTLGLMHHIEHLVIIGEACRTTAHRHGTPVSHAAIVETARLIGPKLHDLIMKSWGMTCFERYYRAASDEVDNGDADRGEGNTDTVLQKLDRLQETVIAVLGSETPRISIDGFDDNLLMNAISTVVPAPSPSI